VLRRDEARRAIVSRMRVSSLQLTNFRGFADATIDFDPQLTVLVGVNGAGKSSVLDALSVLLAKAFHSKALPTPPPAFTDRDVQAGANEARAKCVYVHSGLSVDAEEAHTRGDARVWQMPYVPAARTLLRVYRLAVYYPSKRGVVTTPERLREPYAFEPVDALDLALEARTEFRLFFEWFRDREDLENQERARVSTSYRDPALEAVRSAIVAFMPNVSDPRVQRVPQRFVVTKEGSTLEIDQLSDGERNLLAMVGDLARRLAMASLSDALAHEAVVMIDEVELHLHPGLQREILPRLLKTFPNTQFIVTTHSPQVLASVHAKNVRLLDAFQIKPLERSTWQRDTNTILESVFGDPGRPPEVAKLLAELEQAVETDEVTRARKLIRELKQKVEGTDPDVLFWEQLLPPETAEDAAKQGTA
jgi:predicted ATP-binding protein involved in virulence